MALTDLSSAAWKETFKNVGRLVMVRNLIGGDIPTFHSGVVVATQKLATEDYLLTSSIIPTFVNNMNTLASNLASAKTNVNNTLNTFVTSIIKPDITSDATTVSGVLNDMFSLMRTHATVAVSGVGLFQAAFGEVFGFLPHFYPRYQGVGGATMISPDAGACTLPIRESYATFDWADWNS